MDIFETLSKYGVTLDAIQSADKRQDATDTLRKVYQDLLTKVKGSAADESKRVTDQLKDAVSAESDSRRYMVENNLLKLWDMLAYMVENDPESLIIFVDGFREVSKAVTMETTYVTDSLLKKARPGLGTTLGSDTVSDLANLKKAIMGLVNFGATIPDDFWTKNRMPGETSKGVPGKTRGRGATYKRLRFSWNGQILPNGTTPTEAIHNHVNDIANGYVLTWRTDVLPMLNDKNIKLASDKWELEFKTGILSGWPEADDNDTDSDETDTPTLTVVPDSEDEVTDTEDDASEEE